MNALLRWYGSREERDQRILRIAAVLVPLVLVVGLLLSLQQRVATADARVAQKRRDLAWLQMAVPQLVAQQRAGGGRPAGESLVVTADRVARESGFALAGSEPSGNGALRVRVEKASFDSIALWLGQLAQRNGVGVDTANIDATDAEGVVNATLVLRNR